MKQDLRLSLLGLCLLESIFLVVAVRSLLLGSFLVCCFCVWVVYLGFSFFFCCYLVVVVITL